MPVQLCRVDDFSESKWHTEANYDAEQMRMEVAFLLQKLDVILVGEEMLAIVEVCVFGLADE